MKLRTYDIRTGLLVVVLSAPPLSQRASGEVVHVPSIDERTAPGRMEVLVHGPWGSGPGQFGKVDEASRPGPMDFGVRDDTLYVLDAVNGRVQLFDLRGDFQREISIGTNTANFMCVDDAGNVTVLDAFVRREFKTFSPFGELLARAKVPESIELCSAIWADGDHVWIEERHDRVYEVSVTRDRRGIPAKVVGALTGRPLRPSRSAVHARRSGASDVIVQGGTPMTLRFDRPVASIAALESDDSGQIYLAATCRSAPDGDPWKTEIVLVALEADGSIAGTVRMPNAYVTDHYRKLCVSRAGEIIQMQTAEDGVLFVRWTLAAQVQGGTSR